MREPKRWGIQRPDRVHGVESSLGEVRDLLYEEAEVRRGGLHRRTGPPTVVVLKRLRGVDCKISPAGAGAIFVRMAPWASAPRGR